MRKSTVARLTVVQHVVVGVAALVRDVVAVANSVTASAFEGLRLHLVRLLVLGHGLGCRGVSWVCSIGIPFTLPGVDTTIFSSARYRRRR